MTQNKDLESEFKELEIDSAIENELNALKQKVANG